MSPPSQDAPPYRRVLSGRCRDSTRQLLTEAAALGRFAEVAQAVRDIHTRLAWIPLDFGKPLRDLADLGLQEHIGTQGPLVVTYGVDEIRRIVCVALPFQILPRSGL